MSLFISILFAAQVFAADNLIMAVGETRLIPGHSVRMEKSKVAKISLASGRAELFAQSPGRVQVHTSSGEFDIIVLSSKQKRTLDVLRPWARKNLGLRVDVRDDEVLLSGRLPRIEAWLGLRQVCSDCDYRVNFTVTDRLRRLVEERLTQLTVEMGAPTPSLRWADPIIWILPPQAPSALVNLARSLGLLVSEDKEALGLAPMIRTQIYVMEVRKDRNLKYGVQWPGQISGRPDGSGVVTGLEFSAHALEAAGDGRVLARPTLLCRSGESAEFLAGGEFPIKVFNDHAQDVVWKRYGILLKVTPKADRFGRMNMAIETEISNIDPSRTVDGIPGLLTNRVRSYFDLEGPDTIVLGGLIKSEDSRAVQGLPGLQNIPVLGSLFGSKDFRENRTELVILVRPETYLPQARNVEAAK